MGLYDELNENLLTHEKEILRIREQMSKISVLGLSRRATPEKDSAEPKDILVSVNLQNSLLKITAPLTLIRYANESKFLANEAAASIKEYEEKNRLRIGSIIKLPVHVIIKRKSMTVGNGFRDNENLETKKILDIIFSALGYPDSPENAGYTSLFQLVDDEKLVGTDIYIFNKNNLSENWHLFSF